MSGQLSPFSKITEGIFSVLKKTQKNMSQIARHRSAPYWAVGLVIAVKLFLLLWTAHPFDFWTFVLTFQRQTLYDWNVFEFWNKGNLLIILWYPLYALYLKAMVMFNNGADSLLALHTTFKLPFLLLDLWGAFLLFRIGTLLKDRALGKKFFWLWFLNPIVFYVYGIHGHYELLVPFGIILLLYGVLTKKALPIAGAIVVLFTTKYFALVLLPFVALYLLAKREYRVLLLATLYSVVGVVISYAHLFADGTLLAQVIGSIFSLSSSGAAPQAVSVTIPSLNFFSAINWGLYPDLPINSSRNSVLLPLAALNLKLVFGCYIAHLGYRLWSLWKSRQYSRYHFFFDLFLTIVYLLIFLTNFQPHYISWLLPFILILGVERPLAYAGGFALMLAGFFYTFKNEIGPRTFYLDILRPEHAAHLGFDKVDTQTMYGLGAAIIFSIVLITIAVWPRKSTQATPQNLSTTWYWLYGISWLAILLVTARVILSAGIFHLPTELSYLRNNRLHAGVIFAMYEVVNRTDTAIEFSEKNSPGILMAQELAKLPEDKQQMFHMYLVMRTPGQPTTLHDVAESVSINGCKVVSTTVTYLGNGRQLPALEAPITCLQPGTITVTAPTPLLEPRYDVALYIENKPAIGIYSESQRVRLDWLGVLGCIYVAGAIIGGRWLIRRFIQEAHD